MRRGPLSKSDAGKRAGYRKEQKRLHFLEVMAVHLESRGVKMMSIPREDWRVIQERLREASCSSE